MLFFFGYLAGLLTAVLVLLTLVFFKSQVQQITKVVQTKVEQAGPRPKGDIFIPQGAANEAREEIIKKNREAGRDTPIEELQ